MLMFLDDTLFQRRTLSIVLLAAAIVFVLWNIPQLDFLLYPFRLFVTFVHEAAHSLAAEFTGGRVIEFTVYGNGTGVATTMGGNRLLILPAGYLGAAFFGALLFYLANTVPYPRKIALVVGTIIMLIALFFRATGIALVVGAFTGLGLVLMGIRSGIVLNVFVLNLLAIITGLNAVLDLLFLVYNDSIGLGDIHNDAAAFAALTPGIPAWTWALVWAILAIFMLGSAVWYSVVRPLRQQELI